MDLYFKSSSPVSNHSLLWQRMLQQEIISVITTLLWSQLLVSHTELPTLWPRPWDEPVDHWATAGRKKLCVLHQQNPTKSNLICETSSTTFPIFVTCYFTIEHKSLCPGHVWEHNIGLSQIIVYFSKWGCCHRIHYMSTKFTGKWLGYGNTNAQAKTFTILCIFLHLATTAAPFNPSHQHGKLAAIPTKLAPL